MAGWPRMTAVSGTWSIHSHEDQNQTSQRIPRHERASEIIFFLPPLPAIVYVWQRLWLEEEYNGMGQLQQNNNFPWVGLWIGYAVHTGLFSGYDIEKQFIPPGGINTSLSVKYSVRGVLTILNQSRRTGSRWSCKTYYSNFFDSLSQKSCQKGLSPLGGLRFH